MLNKNKIDLDEVRTPRTSGLLSGRDAGLAARERFRIGKLDSAEGTVEVVIPDAVFSLNTSFFLGLFGESVRALGPEAFRRKYQFVCDETVHRATIERGIVKALKDQSVLPEKKRA
jgi:hypothetical protein